MVYDKSKREQWIDKECQTNLNKRIYVYAMDEGYCDLETNN